MSPQPPAPCPPRSVPARRSASTPLRRHQAQAARMRLSCARRRRRGVLAALGSGPRRSARRRPVDDRPGDRRVVPPETPPPAQVERSAPADAPLRRRSPGAAPAGRRSHNPQGRTQLRGGSSRCARAHGRVTSTRGEAHAPARQVEHGARDVPRSSASAATPPRRRPAGASRWRRHPHGAPTRGVRLATRTARSRSGPRPTAAMGRSVVPTRDARALTAGSHELAAESRRSAQTVARPRACDW